MTEHHLPDFENPPVVETVHGMQFHEIKNLGSGRLGAFWNTLGDDWPQVDDAPALSPQFEQFENVLWGPTALELAFSKSPRCRLMIRNAAKDRLIQVQNGQFHWNWLRQQNAVYPRYRTVKQEFENVLGRFKEFLEGQRLGPLKPNQWEITYLNHLPQGTVWESPNDWPFLFPTLPTVQRKLSNAAAESFEGQWHFQMPGQRGRLHVQIRHERKADDQGERLVLTLTTRGPANSLDDVEAGLDLGHQTIVTAFKELTSDQAHRIWGLR